MSFKFPVFPFAAAVAPAVPASSTSTSGHTFRCTDPLGGKVAEVSRDGKIGWEFKWDQPRDLWVMPDGNTFFSHPKGVQEKLPDARTLWEYTAEGGSDVYSCQPLPTGRFLVVENGPCRLVEVDTFGEFSKQMLLTPPHPRLQIEVEDRFRGVRRSADGRYLVCRKGEHVVEELDANGKTLQRIDVPGDPHMATRLPDGNLLIALGDGHRLQELDATLKVVWEIGENEIRGNPLRLVSGFQRLANGNTIVCNFLGEDFSGKQPHLFEVTRDKKLVWEFADHANFKSISQIQVLDNPEEIKKGTAMR